MEDEVTFLFQLGVLRDAASAPAHRLTLAHLKELAVKFVHEKIPDNGLNRLSDRILLFRHDYCSPNVLQLINSATDVTDETLVEIVLTANPLVCDGAEAPAPRPHALAVHSYKAPTFCDFCGEMLFGLVRQGLKCEGCGLNYHKRCAVKVPSNCASPAGATAGARRQSAAPRSPSRASAAGHASAQPDDSLISSTATSKRSNSAWSSSLGIPHTFQVHTYTRPTVCRLCKKLLRGLFKQGLQCGDCHYNAHRKCLPLVPKDCGGEIRDHHGENQDSCSTSSEISEPRTALDDDSDDADHDHDHRSHNHNHNHHDDSLCLVPSRQIDEDEEPQRDVMPERAASRPSSSSSSPSANIPLMRIVQSVKHTKKRDGQWLKEGWLVHYTNKDKTIKRHYWRLDSKSITLFTSEQGTKYYKEIPLNEILAVDTARQPQSDVMHCFELRTANVDYLVGVDPTWQGGSAPLPPPDSGVGAYLARSWETALRHALMPHTHSAREESPGFFSSWYIYYVRQSFMIDVLCVCSGGESGERGCRGGGRRVGRGGARGGDGAAVPDPPGRGAGLGAVRHRVRRHAPRHRQTRGYQGDRQTAVPDQAGGAAQERGGHPAEPVAPGRREPGAHVRDARAHLRGHGEAEGRHAGDDPVAREGPPHGEDHQVYCCTDPGGPQASAREEHRALRPQARERAAVERRDVPASEAVRLRLRQDHRREVLQALGGRHARILSAGGAAQQGLQPVAGHVVGGRDRVRVAVGHLPLQRGRGHQRADPERRLHVPARALARDLLRGDRPDQQPAASEAAQAAERGQVPGARVAADAPGVERPARARAPRGRALPHARQRRRAPRRLARCARRVPRAPLARRAARAALTRVARECGAGPALAAHQLRAHALAQAAGVRAIARTHAHVRATTRVHATVASCVRKEYNMKGGPLPGMIHLQIENMEELGIGFNIT